MLVANQFMNEISNSLKSKHQVTFVECIPYVCHCFTGQKLHKLLKTSFNIFLWETY